MMNRNGEYSGCVDCVTKLIRSEGFFALWKGFTPYFFRLGPHTILTFVFLEQLNKLFAKYYMKENSFVSYKHFTPFYSSVCFAFRASCCFYNHILSSSLTR